MDGKLLARLGAIIFVAVAITATAIEMTRKEDAPASQVLRPVPDTPADPLWRQYRPIPPDGSRAESD